MLLMEGSSASQHASFLSLFLTLLCVLSALYVAKPEIRACVPSSPDERLCCESRWVCGVHWPRGSGACGLVLALLIV